MTKVQVFDAICIAFSNLSDNQMIYDYWISELYDEEGDLVDDNWTEETAKLMQQDVEAIMI